MATMITSECINCGACEPECPNTAIYQGGVAWDWKGQSHPALSQDIFFIVPEKCTECVGFHDQEACAAVCPVDCCVPDPKYPESEAQLLERAKEIHPGTEFPADFPSRFKGAGNGAAAKPAVEPATGATVTASDSAAAVPAAATPATVKPAPATTTAPPAAEPPAVPNKPPAAPAVAGALGARVEKPLAPPKANAPRAPIALKEFPQDLPCTFEDAVTRLGGQRRETRFAFKALAFLASPLLGALPVAQKRVIEESVGDTRAFSVAGATGFNIVHNMVLYPLVCATVAVVWLGKQAFSGQITNYIVLGIALASIEAILRVREGFRAQSPDRIQYRGTYVYGWLLSIIVLPLITLIRRNHAQGSIVLDGFHGGTFEQKTERERRYGEVYDLREESNGYFLRFEFPRSVPKSASKADLGIDDEMPDYDYDLALEGMTLVVKGSIRDPNVRKLAAVSPAFPPDFTTNIQLPGRAVGFKHRIEDKVLEVVLLKG